MTDDLPVCPICEKTFPCTNLSGQIPIHSGREDASGVRARTCPGSLKDGMQVIQLKKGKFKACPFCASDNLWVRIDRKGISYVECSGCCAHGPIVTDILDAAKDETAIKQIIERWNTRKGQR